MKAYPSIEKTLRPDLYVYAFDKLDGSNIRAEWSKKRGFYKFGTRHQMIDESSKPFGAAISNLKNKYQDDLMKIFKEQGWEDVVCFFEYHGPNSFAGNHLDTDTMDTTLFDVNIYKKGLMDPDRFLKLFRHLDIPRVLFEGYITSEFVDQVKDGTLPGITFEGVICKSPAKVKMTPEMFKIKNRAWLEKLKTICRGDTDLFNRLA